MCVLISCWFKRVPKIVFSSSLKVKFAQSYPTLCEPMDNTVHGILQARILEWVAFPFSKGFSQTKDWTKVSHIAGGFFTSWATREAQEYWRELPIPSPTDLSNLGIEPGSPALQVDFLPTEVSGRPSSSWSLIKGTVTCLLLWKLEEKLQYLI